MPMTFSQFQASGQGCEDLGVQLNDDSLKNSRGRTYCHGKLWIEDTTTWPTTAPGYGKGRWYTLIGREDYQSDDLATVEVQLYNFAVSEEYTV